MQLEEDRLINAYIAQVMQRRRQAWVTMNVKFKVFKVDEWVLIYNNSSLGPHPRKLKLRYIGPF